MPARSSAHSHDSAEAEDGDEILDASPWYLGVHHPPHHIRPCDVGRKKSEAERPPSEDAPYHHGENQNRVSRSDRWLQSDKDPQNYVRAEEGTKCWRIALDSESIGARCGRRRCAFETRAAASPGIGVARINRWSS